MNILIEKVAQNNFLQETIERVQMFNLLTNRKRRGNF